MLSKTYTKYIQSLHHKKFRDEHDNFIAEGSKVVMDLLISNRIVCERILGKQAWLNDFEGRIRTYYKGPLEVIEDHELEKISALNTPNQVLGIFKKKQPAPIHLKGSVTLALDTIQDPGNLGTIIRTADWFGVKTIVCSENCADMYNPKVVQSTMGSIARVNVVYTDLVKWLDQIADVRVYAAALEGRHLSDLHSIREGIIVIGNESKGISPEVMELAGQRITIPKIGEAESLNASVAAGIILSHILQAKITG